MKRLGLIAISLSIFWAQIARGDESKTVPLDDLKKLDIICFAPAYLPKDFKSKSAHIIYEDDPAEGHEGQKGPTYAIEWSGPKSATFSIESAWWGIGDRVIMETEDAEDAEVQSPVFARIYLSYTPKGQGANGVKKEILSNWVEDANMQAEVGRAPGALAVLGRFHGFTGTNMTVAEFEKIVNSLHPIKSDAKTAPGPPPLKLHPKVFNMIDCWVSDSSAPIATEINLYAVEMDKNQFNMDEVRPDGEWMRAPTKEDGGFMRYRVLGLKGNRYTVEYQENGGGSLTTNSRIEFTIDRRTIQHNEKSEAFSVLRVMSCRSK